MLAFNVPAGLHFSILGCIESPGCTMLSQEKPPHSRCTEHKENYKESDIKKSLPPRSGRINTAGSIAWTVSPVSGKHPGKSWSRKAKPGSLLYNPKRGTAKFRIRSRLYRIVEREPAGRITQLVKKKRLVE